jgi:hypothetical protein
MTAAPRSLRVFVNATGVDVSAGSTALDAVRAWNAAEADAVAHGERLITDSRGLPVNADIVVQAGSIFRLVSGRKSAAPITSEAPDDDAEL